MTPTLYDDLTRQLNQGPQSLEQLHGLIQELGSDWSLPQLQLFLTCMDGVEVGSDGQVSMGAKSTQELLLAAVVDVVKSQGGRPIPAAQVLRLLPSQFVTTEAQIKALAKSSTELEVFGPGLLKLK
jgi:hypothetical protein